MRGRGLKRLVASLLVCLAGSACTSCYKSYVRAHVPRCPELDEPGMVQLIMLDEAGKHEALVGYVSDDIIPYCDGIDGLLDE
jgi:hypothetical protein